MPRQALRALMDGLIDYAGLFPPARLTMADAAEEFARWKRDERAWVLGRFICPASRLEELSRAAAVLMPGTYATSGYREHAPGRLAPGSAGGAWRVSVLADRPLEETIDLMAAFNERHARDEGGRAEADAIEIKVNAPGEIDPALDRVPEGVQAAFEFSIAGECRGFVTALAGGAGVAEGPGAGGAMAKVRTGGITPDLIPSAEHLARFIHACADADVAFKATAGLHHACRGEHALDRLPAPGAEAPRGLMHGFLNVFMAACLVRAERVKIATTLEVLDERDPGRFQFADDAARWRGHVVDAGAIARCRTTLARSFGSCSIDEPMAELAPLG